MAAANDALFLEEIIAKAIKKINGVNENDVCKYLPVASGGYMHHFTLRKMKTETPKQLSEMIEEFILNADKPCRVPPKSRAPRGSRKRAGQINLTKNDLDRILAIARMAGDKEMIAKLTPKKSLATLKKELISSIRQGNVEHDLWTAYVELVNNANLENVAATATLSANNLTTALNSFSQ
jgi:hypothetical protein